MATIDIHNLSGEKVGTFDLADEIFGAVNEDLLWEAVKHYRAGQRAGTHKTKAAGKFPDPARSCGSRRARAARVSVRSVRLCGGMADGARTAAALLRLHVPAQEAAGRVALGAGVEVCRRQADRGQCVRREGSRRPRSSARRWMR